MMEDNGNREQTGALPLEGSFPETVPGTVGERHIRKENAVFPYLPAWKNSRNGSRKGKNIGIAY